MSYLPLLWRPRQSIKNGPFRARKVGVALLKGGRAWRDRRGKVPRPQPRPQGPWVSCLVLSLGLSFGVPADRSKTVLFMPEKWVWPSEKGACQGGIKGARCPSPCHAPLGSLGGALRLFLAGKSPFLPIFVTRFLAVWCPESGRGLPRGRGGMPRPLWVL